MLTALPKLLISTSLTVPAMPLVQKQLMKATNISPPVNYSARDSTFTICALSIDVSQKTTNSMKDAISQFSTNRRSEKPHQPHDPIYILRLTAYAISRWKRNALIHDTNTETCAVVVAIKHKYTNRLFQWIMVEVFSTLLGFHFAYYRYAGYYSTYRVNSKQPRGFCFSGFGFSPL